MHPSRLNPRRSLLLVMFFCLCTIPAASFAEPPPIALEQSQDPTLIEARKWQLRNAAPGVANQEKAAELFLKFVDANPDSELIPLIYRELGNTYTQLATPEYQKYGAKYDERQALVYFRKAMAAYPKGKVGPTLNYAWVSVAALTPGQSASALAYLDYLEWLHSLTLEEISKRLWFTEEQQALVDAGQWSVQSTAEGFLRQVKQMQGVATTNMLSIINGVEDDSERIALLEQVASRLPDTDAGQQAAERLQALGLTVDTIPRPTTPPPDPHEWVGASEKPAPPATPQPAALAHPEIGAPSAWPIWTIVTVLGALVLALIVFAAKKSTARSGQAPDR